MERNYIQTICFTCGRKIEKTIREVKNLERSLIFEILKERGLEKICCKRTIISLL